MKDIYTNKDVGGTYRLGGRCYSLNPQDDNYRLLENFRPVVISVNGEDIKAFYSHKGFDTFIHLSCKDSIHEYLSVNKCYGKKWVREWNKYMR